MWGRGLKLGCAVDGVVGDEMSPPMWGRGLKHGHVRHHRYQDAIVPRVEAWNAYIGKTTKNGATRATLGFNRLEIKQLTVAPLVKMGLL